METTVSVKSVDTSSILAPFFCKTGSLHPSPLIHDRLPAPYPCCSMFWEFFHSAIIQHWMGKGGIVVESSEFYEEVIIMAEKMPCQVNYTTTFVTYCRP